MSDTPTIVYRARKDATPQGERAALAAVYSLILNAASREPVSPDGRDEEGSHCVGAGDAAGEGI